MNACNHFSLAAVILLAGCRPQVDVAQPYPASFLVQELRPAAISDDCPLFLLNPPQVPEGRLEVLDLPYDPATEMTVRDVVLGKRLVKLTDGHTGVVVRLQPGGDFIDVLAGTTRFLADHEFEIGIADPLQATGSLVRWNGRPMLLARELVWRGRTLQVRDEEGRPLWNSGYNLARR